MANRNNLSLYIAILVVGLAAIISLSFYLMLVYPYNHGSSVPYFSNSSKDIRYVAVQISNNQTQQHNTSNITDLYYVIPVRASGAIHAVPTETVINLNVNGTENTSQLATANISSTLNRLNSTLSTYLNGNMSLVKTESYNIKVIYAINESALTLCLSKYKDNMSICKSFSSTYKPVFMVSESLRVTLLNSNRTSNLLGSLASIPNVYISSVSSTLSDKQITEMRLEALKMAVQNATEQAQAVVGNSTVLTLGNVTIDNNNVYYPVYNTGLSTVESTNIAPQYYTGINDVVETITAYFHYKGMRV